MDPIKLVQKDKMVEWRRHIHSHPELSFHEVETAKYIKSILETYPNLEISSLTETSVIAVLKGSKPGKTIAFRADIDALPVHEETDIDSRSKIEGVMHACGHDTHTAMLLGAVDTLSKLQDEIEGQVKFIFQPAEEKPPGGAKFLVEAGVLDDVDMIFGLHVMPNIPVGMISVSEGSITASSDSVTIVVKGKGSHSSSPELSIDPILIGVEIINNINHIVSRNVSPFDNLVISAGEFNSGKTANVIPNTARIQLSIRSKKPEIRMYAKKRIEEIVNGVCSMYSADYDLDYLLGYSSVKNDSAATDFVFRAGERIVGKDNIIAIPKSMSSDDFSAYTEVKPGSYYILGAGTKEEGCGYMIHSPKFKFNEDALQIGAAMHVQIVLEVLGKYK
ncbi:amidohydrolase [Clostridioides mangenotii]|uniref:M20 metallopeptidase family protein n=1 Tax=Metaclostridioides mangenotii TaxID=1540 RepID=UPI001C0F8F35|nr:amidohydrolase [Clostridioides mangenotii]MBU5307535.1 amidohydrolase [Clostridioides mangenotii]